MRKALRHLKRIMCLSLACLMLVPSTVHAEPNNMGIGEKGEFSDEYKVDYTISGKVTSKRTQAIIKFNSNDGAVSTGTLKINTLATLIFSQNPYRIVFEKGLTDDIFAKNSLRPSSGYPRDIEMVYDNTSKLKIRTYYEDNTERMGRNYKIRFDTNDSRFGNGSTLSTLVHVVKTEVPNIEALDYTNTGRKKQSVTENKNRQFNFTIKLANGNSYRHKVYDIGFQGTLFFKHWSVYNTLLKKEQIYKSGADIAKRANLSGQYGGKVVATAIWESRNFVFGTDFNSISRVGYIFKGWKSLRQNKLLSKKGDILTVTPTAGNANLNYNDTNAYDAYNDILQAQWVPKKYRLILDGNQPVGTKTIEVRLIEFDSLIPALPVLTLDGYTFKGWFTGRIGGTPAQLNRTWTYDHGITLYAHWEKDTHIVEEDPDLEDGEYDFLVPESKIVRAVALDKTDKGVYVLGNHYWNWTYEITCPGHEYNGEMYFCTSFNPEGLELKNNNFTKDTYKSFISAVSPYRDFSYILEQHKSQNGEIVYNDVATLTEDVIEVDGYRLPSEGEMITRYNYDIALHRGDDKLKLADWVNDREISEGNMDSIDPLTVLYNFSSTSLGGTSRKTNGKYEKSAALKFVANSNNVLVKQVGEMPVCSDDGGTVTIDSGNMDYTMKVRFKVFKGTNSLTPNGSSYNTNTQVNTAYKLNIGSNTNKSITGTRLPSGTSAHPLNIEFYPYIRMRYDYIDPNGDIWLNRTAYVLGDYKRQIKFTDYAEIEYDKRTRTENPTTHKFSNEGGTLIKLALKVESDQWLLDKSVQEFANDNGSTVLPGGATLTISTNVDDRRVFTVRTYQCTLTPDGKNQVEKTMNTTVTLPTEAEMKQAHDDFVSTVITGLDNIEIRQYQYKSTTLDSNINKSEVKTVYNKWANLDFSTPGVEVYAGKSDDGYSLSTDKKYYFRSKITDSSNAINDNRNDIDVRIPWKSESNHSLGYDTKIKAIYTFRTDTSGNIIASKWDGLSTINVGVLLTKNETANDLKTKYGATSEYYLLDQKTQIIGKLRDALEYNKGNDNQASWASDGKWYNEAFDGVQVYVYETQFETGLVDNNFRSQVLDPKLNTVSTSSMDKFSSFAVNQFRSNNYSMAYESVSDKTNLLGTFKTYKVHLNEMNLLYVSEPFYNTNVTVQDKK